MGVQWTTLAIVYGSMSKAVVMSLKELLSQWESFAQGRLTRDTYEIHLSLDDAAKLNALAEMYPKRTPEQLLSELVSAALGQLEASFPYVQGNRIIATDELGDPIYEDVGPTPRFLALTNKYLEWHRRQG